MSLETPLVQNTDIILELVNISKYFGSFQALKNVSLNIKKGEILAVLGENGAGKSTLMKILSGLYQPDGGIINLNHHWFENIGENKLTTTVLESPRIAMKIGLGMVYQHFQLVEPFTVAENITLGQEFTKGKMALIDYEKSNDIVLKLGKEYGLPIDPSAKVKDLPVGMKQRVEILKQLYRDAELLILDEPTAVLTPQESEELFKTMRNLKTAGKSLIFISHKLHEPLAVADRIVVIRAGEMVGEILPKDATKEVLAEMVVGKKLMESRTRRNIKSDETVLELKNISYKSEESDKKILDNISFKANKNQILGIAGVVGNGQKELLESIMGIKKITEGEIILKNNGETIKMHELNTLEILKKGIAYIPEDRSTEGLILDFQITDNIWLAYHGNRESADHYYESVTSEKIEPSTDKLSMLQRAIIMPKTVIDAMADAIVKKFNVKTDSIHNTIRNLSGGNQQKVLLGREFSKFPNLVIASEPTRGVDIGVMTQVHEALIKMRDEGASVVVVSSDLDEVLSLADILIILYDGKIAGMGPVDEFSLNRISQLMTTGEYEKEVTK